MEQMFGFILYIWHRTEVFKIVQDFATSRRMCSPVLRYLLCMRYDIYDGEGP